MLASLLGLLAVAVDGGDLYLARRQLQSAADLAALAGAQRLYDSSDAAAVSDATSFATLNGASSAIVNVPPTSGPYSNQTEYVEVILSRSQPTFFAGLFGINQVTVSARAVARSGRDTPPYALLALSKTASPAIDFGGSNLVKINGAGIMSNSGMGPSIRQSSNSGYVDSEGPVNAVGSIVGNYDAPQVRSGVPPYPDPLAGMSPPTYGYMGSDVPVTRSASQVHPNKLVIPSSGGPLPPGVWAGQEDAYTFGPGVYWGGIQIAGGTYKMGPGIYVISGGGFAITGGTLTGSGIFIYNTNDPRPNGGVYGGAMGDYGPININTNQGVTLYASHVPLYPGMPANLLIYQDPGATDSQDAMGVQAVGNTSLYGTIYIPTNGISISGGGAAGVAHGQVIASTVSFSGNSAAGITYDPDWAVITPGSTLAE